MKYCKTIDKNGRTVYWKVYNSGKRVRVSQDVGKSQGTPPDCPTTKKGPAKGKEKEGPSKGKEKEVPRYTFNKYSVEELKKLARQRGVYPKRGSGKNGRVLKKDLIDALSGKGPSKAKKEKPKKPAKGKEKEKPSRPKSEPKGKEKEGPSKGKEKKVPRYTFNKYSVEELKKLARQRGVYPKRGSGKGGRVLRKDLVDALSGKKSRAKKPGTKKPGTKKPGAKKPETKKPGSNKPRFFNSWEQFFNTLESMPQHYLLKIECRDIMQKYNIKTKKDFRKWMLERHPDKTSKLPESQQRKLEEEFKELRPVLDRCFKEVISESEL